MIIRGCFPCVTCHEWPSEHRCTTVRLGQQPRSTIDIERSASPELGCDSYVRANITVHSCPMRVEITVIRGNFHNTSPRSED